MRVLLRDACQRIDQARTGERAGPAALGRGWWLLETLAGPIPEGLLPVVGLLALGHSNKVISYELGLAWSTVRVLVHRAARKLGVGTRKELERTAAALQETSGIRDQAQSSG